ncbi:hypothetical protein ACWCOV_21645 [Kribbella sp. NPDC002412]
MDWGESLLSGAAITELHGSKATLKSLHLLGAALAVEPDRTAEFLASLPPTASPYHLDRRVKSPESLARKLRNWQGSDVRRPVDDLLRYTMLTETPEDLVAAARHTADQLTGHRWRVKYAVHSYSEGSRYKGIHAYFRAPGVERIEVQFHSVASMKVKELTTPWYEIERSATATDADREVARQRCMEASARLSPPPGISELTTLGGRTVAVKNYSDSRHGMKASERVRSGTATPYEQPTTACDKNGGIAR